MGTRHCIIVAVIAILCLVPTVAAAFVNSIQFEQVTVAPTHLDADPVTPGPYGMVIVGFDKEPETMFLNMVAEVPGPAPVTAWIVRNMPLVDMTYGQPFEEIGYRFPWEELGVMPGEMVTEIMYGFMVTPNPLTDDEAAAWMPTQVLDQIAPVFPANFMVGGGLSPNLPGLTLPSPPPGFFPPYALGPFLDVSSWIGCEMDNVDLVYPEDKNGCVPAAAANSLEWLKNKHDDIQFEGSTGEIYEQLTNLMNRLAGKGVTAKEMVRAKLDFIEAHNLPIRVKFQDHFNSEAVNSSSMHTTAEDSSKGLAWPSKDWLFSESKSGEDVEVMYGFWYEKNGKWYRDFGHCVTVTGTGTVLGIPFVTFKSDSNQTTPGGAAHEMGLIRIDGSGAMILPGFGGNWKPEGDPLSYEHIAKIDGVVSESRDTTVVHIRKAEYPFHEYCEYFTINIAPGDSLSIAFPDTSKVRNFNVQIYEVDRTVKPPKPRIRHVWRNNGRRTRTYVNDSDLVKTVKIHNDEKNSPDQDGYRPWEIGFEVTPDQPQYPPQKNFEDGGGFSLGGNDDSAWEFGDINQPMVDFMAGVGASLGDMPAHLGVSGGTQDLWIHWTVENWNPWWEQLGFVLDVAEVIQPGDLLVEIPETGDVFTVPIGAPGRYEQVLMPTMPGPEIRVHLWPQNGLEMTLDAVGVPTLLAVVSHAPDGGDLPAKPAILGVHPNPFNPATTIAFGIPQGGPVELGVYDLKGRLVASLHSGEMAAGYHEMVWDGKTAGGGPAAAGIYVARLVANDETLTMKMTLVK